MAESERDELRQLVQAWRAAGSEAERASIVQRHSELLNQLVAGGLEEPVPDECLISLSNITAPYAALLEKWRRQRREEENVQPSTKDFSTGKRLTHEGEVTEYQLASLCLTVGTVLNLLTSQCNGVLGLLLYGPITDLFGNYSRDNGALTLALFVVQPGLYLLIGLGGVLVSPKRMVNRVVIWITILYVWLWILLNVVLVGGMASSGVWL